MRPDLTAALASSGAAFDCITEAQTELAEAERAGDLSRADRAIALMNNAISHLQHARLLTRQEKARVERACTSGRALDAWARTASNDDIERRASVAGLDQRDRFGVHP